MYYEFTYSIETFMFILEMQFFYMNSNTFLIWRDTVSQ